MSLAETRFDQMFPVFDAGQIETAARFASGAARQFAPAEPIYDVGQRNVPTWLVLGGAIEVVRRDGLHRQSSVVSLGAGQFTGEVSQLSGRGTLAAGNAGPEGCTALPFDAAHIRAFVIGSAEVGEVVMRAFILRRVGLIQAGGAGSLLIGPGSPDLIRLQGFLSRNAYPYTVLDPISDEEAYSLIERFGVKPDELPLIVCPNGAMLKRPTDAEVGVCLGITPELDATTVYDVAVVGAGPAGLAAAVYGASEGLSMIVLDQRAYGGQAGASARIENYLGFPTGISGQALAGRAFTQSQKFGAEVAIPLEVTRLDCGGGPSSPELFRLEIAGSKSVQAKTVVIASGARYRRPDISNLSEFDGAGISYWASSIEAKLCEGEEVALIGGGNSAGQAVVFLAEKVKRLWLIVRRDLQATMSRYLVDRIMSLPNVTVVPRSEICGLEGHDGILKTIRWGNLDTGERTACDTPHLFLFIGADPHTAWLEGSGVALDKRGFVLTGTDVAAGRHSLETSRDGIFAIGDVRLGSVKRVAAAVGEGAQVISTIHSFLATRAREGAPHG
jgi:thioredoxin reductase (NADPH)